MNKPFVIFTNFWDVEQILGHGILFLTDEENQYVINFHDQDIDYSVYSIALSFPDISVTKNIETLDFFCPSYDILMDYKVDKDFDVFTRGYLDILCNRKLHIKEWLRGLKKGKIYFLCCWENTSFGDNCHRKILYDLFCNSQTTKNKANFIYRGGVYPWMEK